MKTRKILFIILFATTLAGSLIGHVIAGEKGGNGDGDEFTEVLTDFEATGSCGEQPVRERLCTYLREEYSVGPALNEEELPLEKKYQISCCI